MCGTVRVKCTLFVTLFVTDLQQPADGKANLSFDSIKKSKSSKLLSNKTKSSVIDENNFITFYPVPTTVSHQSTNTKLPSTAAVNGSSKNSGIHESSRLETASSHGMKAATTKKRRHSCPITEPALKKSKHDDNQPQNTLSSDTATYHKFTNGFNNKEISDVCRCDQCDFISIEMSDLREHKLEVHAVKDTSAVLAPCDYNPAVHNDIEYKCTLCGHCDSQLAVIRQHITCQHDGKLQTCERVTHRKSDTGFNLLVESIKVYK